MVAQKSTAKQSRKKRGRMTAAQKAALTKARAAKNETAETVPGVLVSSPVNTTAVPVTTPMSAESTAAINPRESASKRKLCLSEDVCHQDDDSLPTAFVDLSLIETLFSPSCDDCGGRLRLTCSNCNGFAYNLKLRCLVCKKVVSSVNTSKQLPGSNHFEINRRMVLSFLNIGQGYAGLSSFCEVMGLACLSQATHIQHVADIHRAAEAHKESTTQNAVSRIKTAYGKTADDIVDIAVSYDGTWQKRGHTSKHGLGAVIDVATGLTVDYHVMSKYCQQCAVVGVKKKEQDQGAYNEWFQSHKTTCTINHEGSSGMMEVEAAKVL